MGFVLEFYSTRCAAAPTEKPEDINKVAEEDKRMVVNSAEHKNPGPNMWAPGFGLLTQFRAPLSSARLRVPVMYGATGNQCSGRRWLARLGPPV